MPKERDQGLKEKRKGPLSNMGGNQMWDTTARFIAATVAPNRQLYPLPPIYSCCKCAVQRGCDNLGADNKTIQRITIWKTVLLHSQKQRYCRVKCRDVPIHTVSFTSARVMSSASVPGLQGSDSFLQSNSTISPKLQSQKGSLLGTLEKYTDTALAVTALIHLIKTWCSGDLGQE